MSAKEYLLQISAGKARIRRIEENIHRIEVDLTHAKGIRYDTVRVQTSPESVMDRQIAELQELRRKWLTEKTALNRKIMQIQKKIEKLEPRYSELLYRRYVEGLPLWKIADKMGYSDDRIRHIHGEALTAFERKYGI